MVYMFDLGYTTGVNHIKSGQVLLAPNHPFSNCIRGADTMSHSIPDPSTLKVCSKCGEAKPLTEYTMHLSGRQKGTYFSHCRPCKTVACYESKAKNPEKYREIARASAERNREKIRAREAAVYAANPEKRRRAIDEASAKNPQRVKANSAVSYAIDRGVMPPASSVVCESCQEAQAKHYHHHLGYEKEHWLDVVALCTSCHGKAHRVY